MNEMLKKNLLARDKFMPEMHVRQPGFMLVFVIVKTQRKNTKIQRNKRFKINLSN